MLQSVQRLDTRFQLSSVSEDSCINKLFSSVLESLPFSLQFRAQAFHTLVTLCQTPAGPQLSRGQPGAGWHRRDLGMQQTV